MKKRWKINSSDPDRITSLAEALGVEPIVAAMLINRGFEEEEPSRKFLAPSLHDLYDPFLLEGMEEATNRLVEALDNKERIAVYGDYDVDGITSTALLTLFFREIGYPVNPYLPNRLEEGYGLNADAIMSLARDGIKVLVTVDCGVSAIEEAKLAKQCGIDLIITDHHEAPKILPEAVAIVDPKLPGSNFPFSELAGVGVALYLLLGLRRKLCDMGRLTPQSMPNLRRYLDLVALGTVADLVPLIDHNRIFVSYGLKEIVREKRIGIKALREVAGAADREITSTTLGFLVGPRINAAGRMGDPSLALDLLLSQDDSVTYTIARNLDRLNHERQQLERNIVDQAEKMIADLKLHDRAGLVVSGEGWHPGVIGIVASRLVERYLKPCVVITYDAGEGRGSARGLPGMDLYSIISSIGDCLKQFGGHQLAAGLAIMQDKDNEFRDRFIAGVEKQQYEIDTSQTIIIDAEVKIGEVTRELIDSIRSLAPFGIGNPEPLFCVRGATVISAREVGTGHLKMVLGDNSSTVETIGFDMAARSPKKYDHIDMVFSPQINRWQGNESVQFRIKDFEVK